jgi:hypothetical protein
VHADLGAEVPVRVRALDGEARPVDAGLVARLIVEDLGLDPRRSAQRKYWRSSISAQSLASVPPVPGGC